eukprot:6070325-Karenia_brevis.AAC.1
MEQEAEDGAEDEAEEEQTETEEVGEVDGVEQSATVMKKPSGSGESQLTDTKSTTEIDQTPKQLTANEIHETPEPEKRSEGKRWPVKRLMSVATFDEPKTEKHVKKEIPSKAALLSQGIWEESPAPPISDNSSCFDDAFDKLIEAAETAKTAK